MREKRQGKRAKTVLPLRVWLGRSNGDFHLVHTLDISEEGARVGGVHIELQPGQIITIERGRKKAKFRVQWTKQLRPNEIRAGIESLEPGKNVWELDISNKQKATGLHQQFWMHLVYAK